MKSLGDRAGGQYEDGTGGCRYGQRERRPVLGRHGVTQQHAGSDERGHKHDYGQQKCQEGFESYGRALGSAQLLIDLPTCMCLTAPLAGLWLFHGFPLPRWKIADYNRLATVFNTKLGKSGRPFLC